MGHRSAICWNYLRLFRDCSFDQIFFRNKTFLFLQVNLFQKHSFLNQLTHDMTTDCSLIPNFTTRKIQAQNMLYTKIVFCFGIQSNFPTNIVLACIFLVLKSGISEQSVVILWVNWFKNECFWDRFTCNLNSSKILNQVGFELFNFSRIYLVCSGMVNEVDFWVYSIGNCGH